MTKIFKLEIMKLKGLSLMWIVTMAPMFMVLQGALNFLRYYDLFTNKGQNIWKQIFIQSNVFYSFTLLPILITIIMIGTARVENNNGGWKYLLSLPVQRNKIYAAKFFIGFLLTLINVLVFIISVLAAGKLAGAPGAIPYDTIVVKPLMAFAASLPIMIITYLLSINFRHMGVPLGVGIGLTLPNILVANTRYWMLYPWTYPAMATLGGDMFKGSLVMYPAALVIFVTLYAIGLYRFNAKDITE